MRPPRAHARDRTITAVAAALAALALASGAGACTRPPHGLSWTIAFERDVLRTRASLVRAEIRAGGCGGAPAYVSEVRPGERASVPPLLPPGRWGFAAMAVSDTCVRFGSACDEVTLPGPTSIASVIGDATEVTECAAATCSAGACPRPDAGVDAGALPGTDAGRDGGRSWSDAGPRDGGPALRPPLPCGSTWEADVDPYFEVTGSVSRVNVVHNDGICSGCTDEVLRLADGTTVALRFAFADDFSPLAVRQSGAGTARIDVCGTSYTCSMSGSGTAGFENIPHGGCSAGASSAVTTTGECTVRITAMGGPVAFRRFDVGCRTASGPPVVDVRLDGDEMLVRPGPASAVLTWSADQAVSCTASGPGWVGPQPVRGSVPVLDLWPGVHTFSLACLGPDGRGGTDSARIEVTP